jgi:Clostripain family
MRARQLLATLILCAAASVASAAPPAAPRAAWTVMVFMNGDNNLEEFALRDFNEMAEIGSNADVNVVVQLDRIGLYTEFNDDQPLWTDTKRFYVRHHSQPVPAQQISSLGEANMGDPATLRDFIVWARSTYPADRYALVIWDHGRGYRGLEQPTTPNSLPFRSANAAPTRAISQDDTDHDELYNAEVTSALREALQGERLDIVAFDACLMSMVETAYAMRGLAQFMVGSEDLEPATGWKYDDVLQRLQAHPKASTREIARAMVQSYRDTYRSASIYFNPTTTQSAIDLTQIDDLAKATSRFADLLSAALPARAQDILRARRDCLSYAPGVDPGDPDRVVFPHIDLGHFAARIAATIADPAIKQAAQIVIESLGRAVVERYAGTSRSGAYGSTGLAIYFPLDGQMYAHDTFEEGGYRKNNTVYPVPFVRDHTWADFLHAYFERVPSASPPGPTP